MNQSWNSALRILSRRDHSRAELERKLKLRKFDATEIQSTLRQLETLGYIDDERVARARLRSFMKKGYSVKGAEGKLKTLGLANETIRTAGRNASQDESLNTPEALDQFILQKLRGKSDEKLISRTLRYFLARGHRLSDLKQTLERLNLKWPKK